MKTKLTASRIGRLRPKTSEYTVWDSITPHFGIRVMPTGAMRFIHVAPTDGRLRKTTIGDAARMPLDEARAAVRDLDAGEVMEQVAPICPTFAEWAQIWSVQAYARIKPETKRGYAHRLTRQLIPTFGPKRLDAINRTAILAWFEPYSRKAPGNANYALSLLGTILNHAKRANIIQFNPVSYIPRNPSREFTRFLSVEERSRLLNELDSAPREHRAKALAVKLLLFTGCRRNEIVGLRWEEVGEKVLNLADSKVGPRKVWLNNDAVATIDEAKTMHSASEVQSEFVFPSPKDKGRFLCPMSLNDYWYGLRVRAGFPDVRLHDLRHSFASEAVRLSVPLPIVSKLLGHSTIKMTMRYVHTSNAEVEAAAERIAERISSLITLE